MLQSAGPHASRDAVACVAGAAEELGLDSVCVPEHLIVGAAAGEGYGRTLDPFAVLGFPRGADGAALRARGRSPACVG